MLNYIYIYDTYIHHTICIIYVYYMYRKESRQTSFFKRSKMTPPGSQGNPEMTWVCICVCVCVCKIYIHIYDIILTYIYIDLLHIHLNSTLFTLKTYFLYTHRTSRRGCRVPYIYTHMYIHVRIYMPICIDR
jgi:hypothetical protein